MRIELRTSDEDLGFNSQLDFRFSFSHFVTSTELISLSFQSLLTSLTYLRFLCIRKERKHNSPPVSAIQDAVDPSQLEPSSDELLALCSGQFKTQDHPPSEERKRHPSDSSSTQGVRELLGLPPIKPKPSGISKLLAASGSGISLNSDATQSSEMNEVLGLCSGVFPATQSESFSFAQRKLLGAPSVKSAGTSDGMSDTSSEGGDNENTVFRWAQRHQGIRKTIQKKLHPLPNRDLSDSDDDDMPVLSRKRSRPRPKPTKE